MDGESKKLVVPRYVPYSTFLRFINGLYKIGVPSHIDRSIMDTMSGSGQSAMIAALKSLQLVDADLEPKPALQKLVNGSEDDFSTTLNTLVHSTYAFLFEDSIQIENTTSKKVEEKFRNIGVSGSTLTKCISFFLAAAKAANISVSPHVKAPKLERKTSAKKSHDSAAPPSKHLVEDEYPEPLHEDMEKITVPLPGMEDGYIYFPAKMDKDQSQLAVKMAKFILNNFYGISDTE